MIALVYAMQKAIQNHEVKDEQLVDTWFEGLSDFDPAPDKHITECLFRLEDLNLEEQDQAQWIMNSDEVYDWLTRTESCVLEISAETAPDGLINPMWFTDAMLAVTLANMKDCPVLSFFCGLRRNESLDEQDSGPTAVLNSLNGQLLKFILQKRPTVDLSFLEEDKYRHKSKKKPKYGSALFKKLVSSLPEKDAVHSAGLVPTNFRRHGTGRQDHCDDWSDDYCSSRTLFRTVPARIWRTLSSTFQTTSMDGSVALT